MAKAETCHNCVYAKWDLALWARTFHGGLPAGPTCANHPDFLGRMRECPFGRVCRNFRPKPPVPRGETVKPIPLGDGYYAYVDAADYAWLSQWNWRMRGGYAARTEKKKVIYMHREIMRPPKGRIVDHKNRNKLDNTRDNLRNATHTENMRNKEKQRGTTSRFKGVSYCKRRGKWYATILVRGKARLLGFFVEEIEAARAYDRAAVEHYGEFARLNFPEEWPAERRAAVGGQKTEDRGRRTSGRTRSRAATAKKPKRKTRDARRRRAGGSRRGGTCAARTSKSKKATVGRRKTTGGGTPRESVEALGDTGRLRSRLPAWIHAATLPPIHTRARVAGGDARPAKRPNPPPNAGRTPSRCLCRFWGMEDSCGRGCSSGSRARRHRHEEGHRQASLDDATQAQGWPANPPSCGSTRSPGFFHRHPPQGA